MHHIVSIKFYSEKEIMKFLYLKQMLIESSIIVIDFFLHIARHSENIYYDL